jgi:hypothetical protein
LKFEGSGTATTSRWAEFYQIIISVGTYYLFYPTEVLLLLVVVVVLLYLINSPLTLYYADNIYIGIIIAAKSFCTVVGIRNGSILFPLE